MSSNSPQFAEVGDVEEFSNNIKSTWRKCRADGHDMRPHDAKTLDTGGFLRTKKCRRCGTLRHQELDKWGLIVNSTLEYPDGYLLPEGTGRLDAEGRAVFRLSVILDEIDAKATRSRR